MTCDLEATAAPSPLYRLGRRGGVWAWPDWAYAGEDGTFGNRYDDPHAQYRVLYASSQRLGTYLETLARFRPDPAILAEPIEEDAADGPYPTSQPGTVPASWLTRRAMGTAAVAGDFADVGHSRSLQHLRTELAARLIHHGLQDLDGATMRMSAPRRFTQEVSRHVYECSNPAYVGIRYLSRLGDDIHNWAIFEPADLTDPTEDHLTVDDPDLQEALARFRLRMAPSEGE